MDWEWKWELARPLERESVRAVPWPSSVHRMLCLSIPPRLLFCYSWYPGLQTSHLCHQCLPPLKNQVLMWLKALPAATQTSAGSRGNSRISALFTWCVSPHHTPHTFICLIEAVVCMFANFHSSQIHLRSLLSGSYFQIPSLTGMMWS